MTHPPPDGVISGKRPQRHIARLSLLGALVVTLVAVVVVTLSIRDTKKDLPRPVAVSLPRLDAADQRWSLAEHRGTPVVINFWASWCTPCRTEMPELDRIARDLSGSLEVVGVNVMDDRDGAIALAEQLGVSYPLVVDPTGEIMKAFGVAGLPTTVLVDHHGEAIHKATGRPTGDELRQMIAEHLGTPP